MQADSSFALPNEADSDHLPALLENELPIHLQYLFPKIVTWATSNASKSSEDPMARVRQAADNLKDEMKLWELTEELASRLQASKTQGSTRQLVSWTRWLIMTRLYAIYIREGRDERGKETILSYINGLASVSNTLYQLKEWDTLIIVASIFCWVNLTDRADEILQILREEIGAADVHLRLQEMIQHPQSLLDAPFAMNLKTYIEG